ncbi:unnamed protein product [Microthlaspi erraticum]|uniref:Uncharacterized protein n=1 Tax=Microthlaspi erraticum TaxID=1685480 RepID=A0A6D2JHN4_9BRAS|nr:unnamed protein product [Microthlaspi erraticum]
MRPFLSWESSGSQKDLKRSSPNPKEAQRENLFHSRCLVQEKKHPKPYQLQWINETGDMSVKEQVLVPYPLEAMKMRFCVMSCLWMLDTSFWEGLGNLIGE